MKTERENIQKPYGNAKKNIWKTYGIENIQKTYENTEKKHSENIQKHMETIKNIQNIQKTYKIDIWENNGKHNIISI